MRIRLVILLMLVLSGVFTASPRLSPTFRGAATSGPTIVPTIIRVYVLDLAGVDTGVGSVTGVQEGIADAVGNRTLDAVYGYSARVTFQLSTVTTWSQYTQLVANDGNFVLVNLHGQYLPIPTGYNSDAWLGTVLNAISVRSVTWVHLGGYPFHTAWSADGTLNLGSQGFQMLAEAGLWTNAAIGPPNPAFPVAPLNPYIGLGYPAYGWWGDSVWMNNKVSYIGDVSKPRLGNYSLITQEGTFAFSPPLYEVAGNDHRLYSVGGVGPVSAGYLQTTGSFVDFDPAALLMSNNTISRVPLEYAKGFLGTLLAIYPLVVGPLSEISRASEEISLQQSVGDTAGLDTAKVLFSQSVAEYQAGHQYPSSILAEQAYLAAQKATTPFLKQVYPYLVLTGGIIGIGLILALGRIGPYAVSVVMGASRPRIFRRKKPKERKIPPKDQTPNADPG